MLILSRVLMVRPNPFFDPTSEALILRSDDVEEADDDDMAEVDTDNIISDGRRTRGKDIDFAKAAEGLDDEDEDEEEDGDFEEPDDEMEE